jgi:glycosyltransferase involved in cell wall biosynthesis
MGESRSTIIQSSEVSTGEGARVSESAAVKLSVVLPAFNEQDAVAGVIAELAETLSTTIESFEILVVDDGSDDITSTVAERAGAQVIRRPERSGYGSAVKAGILAARGEWIALLDADGSYSPRSLPELLAWLPAYDQVNGARRQDWGYFSYVRRLTKILITRLAEWISGRSIADLNTGLKVFKRQPALGYLWTMPAGFSASTALTLAFLCDGKLVKYVPVDYRKRIGRSKFRPLGDTLQYLATIARMILYFRPLRVFLPLAGLISLVAVPLAAHDMLFSPLGLHDADVILFCLAALTAMFGMLAELIVAQRRAQASA